MEQSTTPSKDLYLRLPNPIHFIRNMTNQTKLMIMGVAFPAYLLSLSSWFTFELSKGSSLLHQAKESQVIEDFNNFWLNLFSSLGFWGGALFIVTGVILFFVAVFMFRLQFQRYNQLDLTAGKVRLLSYIYAALSYGLLIGASKIFLSLIQFDIVTIEKILTGFQF